jgi:hypothetical protein
MKLEHRAVGLAAALIAAAGCASGRAGDDDDVSDPDGGGVEVDAGCGELCDEDGDGVVDGTDLCMDTPPGEDVNDVGCSDSQVSPTLEETFPPYGLTWTPTGELGRAGGLTWTYTNLDRGDLFHIYWVVCDDPETPCGVSLDGAIDQAAEHWAFSAAQSDLPAGRLVLTNVTHILLADSSTPTINGRVTVNVAAMPFEDVAALGVPARDGTHGAEIAGAGFQVTAIAEVQDPSTLAWTPYLDYFDAQATPDGGPGASVSFGGSFYDE